MLFVTLDIVVIVIIFLLYADVTFALLNMRMEMKFEFSLAITSFIDYVSTNGSKKFTGVSSFIFHIKSIYFSLFVPQKFFI